MTTTLTRIRAAPAGAAVAMAFANAGAATWMAINGAGILPEYQGRGGNALLYSEMEKTVRGYKYRHADLTQVAETGVQMRQDLINIGGKPYKNHRVYRKQL